MKFAATRIAAFVLLILASRAMTQELTPLKNSVVRLQTTGTLGAGIIAGFDDTRIFIVTAAHVVPDRDVAVQFNAARQRKLPGRVYRQTEGADVAAVVVDVPKDDAIRESLKPLTEFSGSVSIRTVVTTIGHASEDWEVSVGVNRVQEDQNDSFTFSNLGITRGASGGPVFDDNDRLLGMVLVIDGVKARGVKIGKILGLLKAWDVPTNLLDEQRFQRGFIVERFADNRHDWFESKDPVVPVRVEKGVYIVSSRRGGATWSAKNFEFDPRRDFRISCTVKNLRGVTDYFFGLTWGWRDEKHFFDLAITANGHAAVTMQDGATTIDFIDPSLVNSNVKKGRTVNRLTVERKGGQLTMRVNDGVVHTMPFRPLFAQGVGFVVWGDVQVAFDDLEVEVD